MSILRQCWKIMGVFVLPSGASVIEEIKGGGTSQSRARMMHGRPRMNERNLHCENKRMSVNVRRTESDVCRDVSIPVCHRT